MAAKTPAAKPGPKPRFTHEDYRKALREGAGIYTAAAAILSKLGKGSCSASSVKAAVFKSKKLRTLRDELHEEALDLAEAKVLTGIKNGDKTFTIFFLRCHGKARGWVHHHDLDVNAPVPVVVANASEAFAKIAKGMDPDQLRAALAPSGLKDPEPTG